MAIFESHLVGNCSALHLELFACPSWCIEHGAASIFMGTIFGRGNALCAAFGDHVAYSEVSLEAA
ncbi:MAG: hypothetical protein ACKPKO_63175, partial [Candidatus Fonsibacter sp.]